MAGLIEIKTDPTPREVRVFGLLWLIFFGLVGAVAAWRPDGLIGASIVLGTAWLVSVVFNPASRRQQLAGLLLPGLLAGTGGAVLGGVGRPSVFGVLGAVGAAGALAIWAAPRFGKRLYVGWMVAAAPVGWTVSHVVLGTVFYLVLTPVGLILRALGREPLERGFDRQATSYWVRRETKVPVSRYFRQF